MSESTLDKVDQRLLLVIDAREAILVTPELVAGGQWLAGTMTPADVAGIARAVTSALVPLMAPVEGHSVAGMITPAEAELLGLYAGRPPVGGLVTDLPDVTAASWPARPGQRAERVSGRATQETSIPRPSEGAGLRRGLPTAAARGLGGEPEAGGRGSDPSAGKPAGLRKGPEDA